MYYVGVDGGGTNTRVAIFDEQKQLIGMGQSGPSSIDTVSIETSIRHIQEGIEQVFQTNLIETKQIQSIFVGLGGVLTDQSKEMVKNLLKQLPYFNKQSIIQVENDVYSALLGGLGTNTGIVLIAGTGSVAFGLDEKGHTHRAGGYGYQEGDLGSAYHLGKEALMLTSRVFDKRTAQTPFTEALVNYLTIDSVDDLLDVIMDYHDDRTKIASLAPFVTKYATKGDAYAKDICDSAIRELALCVQAVFNQLNLTNKEIAIIGSLGNSGGYFQDQLVQALLTIDSQFDIHKPIMEPVIGSAHQAMKNAILK